MHQDDAKSLPAIGFLTVIEHPQHGLFGGYLVLNPAGRPLEFHCTAPVKANRAQEILYGPTLYPYLYGEQIGQTLVAKSKVAPPVVLTDVEPALALREVTAAAVALVLTSEKVTETNAPPSADETAYRLDPPHRRLRLATFAAGRHQLAVPARFEADCPTLAQQLEAVAQQLDLAEPFERIRDAISEAQKKP